MIGIFVQILLDTALKGAVLVGLGAIAAVGAARSAAATRHMIWSAVIGAHLVLPAVTALGPGFEWRVLPPPPWLGAERALGWVWSVWLTGVIVGLLPIVVGSWRVARLRRGSVRVAGSDGDVDIRYSEQVSVPVVCGILRPSILVPAEAVSWTEARWRLVVQHERGHVRRHDTASQLFAQIAFVVFWFDPLLVMAVRAMRRERELACDDIVLASGVAPWDYAHELIEVARGARRVPAMLAGLATLAMPGSGSGLGDRIRAILDSSRSRRSLRRRDVVLAMCIALLVTVPLGVLRPFRDSLP
jgi:beta-lactamase regulating signal transducer with metallopeptidase domain